MLKRFLKNLLRPFYASIDLSIQRQLAELLEAGRAIAITRTPGNPAAYGFKAYSQADEDGIIEAIADGLEISNGTFVEIGCGRGIENNTHYLLLKGWRGVWIDGDAKNVTAIRSVLPESSPRLVVAHAFVDVDNVETLLSRALLQLGVAAPIDLLSVDIDGNDLAVASVATKALDPGIIVVEYNAKLGSVVDLAINYDPQFRWGGDDYQGASLAAWVRAFKNSHRLVACCTAGTNAFFVKNERATPFGTYSTRELFREARYELAALRSGHAPSLKYLRDVLANADSRGR